MKIATGLFEGMVIQRNNHNVSDQLIEGITPQSVTGVITVQVIKDKKIMKGFKDSPLGKVIGGKFSLRLKGLPTGGPYQIKLQYQHRIKAGGLSITLKNIYVGDVWILAGQSNMQGIGYRTERLKAIPSVRAFYMDDSWNVAEDPIHNLNVAIDECHKDGSTRSHVGTGPGVAFGQRLYKISGVPQGLIACAHGGTTMSQWSPDRKTLGSASLYGALLRRFIKNGSRVAGVFWYQGCSDVAPGLAEIYTGNMKTLINSMRKDFNNPILPVVLVQIGRTAQLNDQVLGWNSIREQQRLLPKVIKNISTVPGIDLELDDGIHIRGREAHRLGKRCADAMALLRYRSKSILPPIEFKKAACFKDKLSGSANVLVRFKNVSGSLKAFGHPNGFSISSEPDRLTSAPIYRTELAGDSVLLKTADPYVEFNERYLFYGFGNNPICNIVDQADRSLPAFGPVVVISDMVFAPPVTKLQVSSLLPSAGKLHNLQYPQDMNSCGFHVKKFDKNTWNFCNMHAELSAREPDDLLVYFLSTFKCDEPMKVDVLLGYDGPVKMWLDKQEIFFDPEGTNPATMDEKQIPVPLAKGEHQVLVALGSNFGKAWGIFLRYARTDLPQALIKKGKDHYKVPEILD